MYGFVVTLPPMILTPSEEVKMYLAREMLIHQQGVQLM